MKKTWPIEKAHGAKFCETCGVDIRKQKLIWHTAEQDSCCSEECAETAAELSLEEMNESWNDDSAIEHPAMEI